MKKKTAKQLKSTMNAMKGRPRPLIEHNKGVITDKHMESPLGNAHKTMVEGRVAHNVKSLDSLGTKIVKRNKVFSNAVPHGYTQTEWNERVKKVLK